MCVDDVCIPNGSWHMKVIWNQKFCNIYLKVHVNSTQSDSYNILLLENCNLLCESLSFSYALFWLCSNYLPEKSTKFYGLQKWRKIYNSSGRNIWSFRYLWLWYNTSLNCIYWPFDKSQHQIFTLALLWKCLTRYFN